MSNIITLSRQFSSGGRELGKILAAKLGYAFYDKDILSQIAVETGLHPDYIAMVSEKPTLAPYSFSVGRSFGGYIQSPAERVQSAQTKIIRELAEKDNCIIVGRCADFILDSYNPLKIFVYSSDIDIRVSRCRDRIVGGQDKTDKELLKEIQRIDKAREKFYSYNTDSKWGDMNNYNLCIDLSYIDIDTACNMIVLLVSTNNCN